jgi:hypothetical protein
MFNLDGIIASLRSVLVYQVPMMNSLFILGTSLSILILSTSIVFVTMNQVKNPEIYSGIWQKVDEKYILVWHTRLTHLSLPAIHPLHNGVNGIPLYARRPSASSCEACRMEKIFHIRLQPLTSEDKGRTWLLELIHSGVTGLMQTQTMRGYHNIFTFKNRSLRYTEGYFTQLKLEALQSSRSRLQWCRSNIQSRRHTGSELTVGESMASRRSCSTIWHRRAFLQMYYPHPYSGRLEYWRDAITQYRTQCSPFSGMLGCQICCALRAFQQQPTSITDYQPEFFQTQFRMRDLFEQSQISHTIILLVA